MRLTNTSRYPTDEVKRLIDFATRGVRLNRVAVNVKNSKSAYAGRAYHAAPFESPTSRLVTVDRLIVLRIGPPDKFPTDNMVRYAGHWQTVPQAEYDALPQSEQTKFRHSHWSDGTFKAQRWVSEPHPYGGKRSPLIVVNDWREALVALAAHEARHVWQFQHRKPTSEVDAEKFAARALDRYRAEFDR